MSSARHSFTLIASQELEWESGWSFLVIVGCEYGLLACICGAHICSEILFDMRTKLKAESFVLGL